MPILLVVFLPSGLHRVLSFVGRDPTRASDYHASQKRQGCVSLSTPEAEIVAANHALRHLGFPALELWQHLTGDATKSLLVHEDNKAMISVCLSGKNPTMRHLKRTHGVNVAWLAEQFARPDIDLVYERSVRMSADIFTKAFSDPLK